MFNLHYLFLSLIINNILNTTVQTFSEIKDEIVKYIQANYNDLYENYNDASIGSLIVDLLAHLGENLNFNINRVNQEYFVDFAQQRISLFNIAKNKGIKIPNKTGSIALCDFTVRLPVLNDAPDLSYTPLILAGAQVLGNGQVFYTKNIIDFNSPYNSLGNSNRTIEPVFDSNNSILYYNVTKSELIYNGKIKIHKNIVFNSEDFYEFYLPDDDVLEILNLTILSGTNISTPPSIEQIYNSNYRYYEVDSLYQNKKFVKTQYLNGINSGDWIEVENRYVKEYTPNGFCKIKFGNDKYFNNNLNILDLKKQQLLNFIEETQKLNNTGKIVPPNSTIFVEYTVGGGINTNVPSNSINSLGVIEMYIDGLSTEKNTLVRNSLTVNNITPAFGGKDYLNNNQIKELIKLNNNNTCISKSDYLFALLTLPNEFGRPYKSNVNIINNQVKICALNVDNQNNISSINETFKNNILNYLNGIKSYKHNISITNTIIYNINCLVFVKILEGSQISVINENIINEINNYFLNLKIGETYNINVIYQIINKINGVLQINDIKFFNDFSENASVNKYQDIAQDIAFDNNNSNINYNEYFSIKNKYNNIQVKYG